MQSNLKLSSNFSLSSLPHTDYNAFNKFITNNRLYFGPKLKLLGNIKTEEEKLNASSLKKFGICALISMVLMYKNDSIWLIKRIRRRWIRVSNVLLISFIGLSISLQSSLNAFEKAKEEQFNLTRNEFEKYKKTGDLSVILDLNSSTSR